MGVDTLRHMKVFDPALFGDRSIDVIGAGATGSRIVLGLAKLGLTRLRVWDFDKVEGHNIANQIFGNDDIGKLKTDAIGELVKRQTGTQLDLRPVAYEGQEPLGDVVFLLTDTMKSRKAIWEKAIRYKPHTGLMVETRMGTDNGRVYAVHPCEPAHVKAWEGSLYEDAGAEVSACGTAQTVGPTAEVISGCAVWHLIRWFDCLEKGGEQPEFETIFGLKPFLVMLSQASA